MSKIYASAGATRSYGSPDAPPRPEIWLAIEGRSVDVTVELSPKAARRLAKLLKVAIAEAGE